MAVKHSPLLEEKLRAVPAFADLTQEELAWLLERAEEQRFATDQVFLRAGDPADQMMILLEGEIQGRRQGGGLQGATFMGRAPLVTGYLPFSRMEKYGGSAAAVEPCWLLLLGKQHTLDLVQLAPRLGPLLVGALADRVRETTKVDFQKEKMVALGRLSAGLAHELNNPASAAQRSVEALRATMAGLRRATDEVEALCLTLDQRELAQQFTKRAGQRFDHFTLTPLEKSDREEQIGQWLDGQGIAEAWQIGPEFVEQGYVLDDLLGLASSLPAEAVSAVLRKVSYSSEIDRLLSEVGTSVERIGGLVKSIKQYSYMDQTPDGDVDIHVGIESTLVMLGHMLRRGIRLNKQFAPDLPKVQGNGGELNQVWTNLIDNACHAMREQSAKGEAELSIRTALVKDRVTIEVVDNGPGIAPELQSKVFEPFFTTKPAGEGIGLGLDVVFRIVDRHHGEIRLTSEPGKTCFKVWLPLRQPQGPPTIVT